MTLPDAFLPTLRARLEALYGARLVRVVLFGSYARGDATPDSDVDVLVVLRGVADPYAEAWTVADLDLDLLDAFGLPVSFVVLGDADAASDWPLLANIRREGRELA